MNFINILNTDESVQGAAATSNTQVNYILYQFHSAVYPAC